MWEGGKGEKGMEREKPKLRPRRRAGRARPDHPAETDAGETSSPTFSRERDIVIDSNL